MYLYSPYIIYIYIHIRSRYMFCKKIIYVYIYLLNNTLEYICRTLHNEACAMRCARTCAHIFTQCMPGAPRATQFRQHDDFEIHVLFEFTVGGQTSGVQEVDINEHLRVNLWRRHTRCPRKTKTHLCGGRPPMRAPLYFIFVRSPCHFEPFVHQLFSKRRTKPVSASAQIYT